MFWQCEYSAYVVGQASRRSWRIGQRRDVHVYHMIYGDSAQENALRLVARKRRAAKLIDGDLDEDGLVAQAEVDGLLKELARSLVDEEAAAAVESAAELLAQARADELANTELIIDAVAADDPAADDDGVDEVAVAAASERTEGLAPSEATIGTTMTLFDYMAAQPMPSRKGKKARKDVPTAQLLLFDLFAGQPAAAEPAPAGVPAETRQLDLFSGAAR